MVDYNKEIDAVFENHCGYMHPYGLKFLDLPVELLIRILLQVEWRSVVTCTGVRQSCLPAHPFCRLILSPSTARRSACFFEISSGNLLP